MLYFRDWTLLLCFFRAVPEPGSLDPFLPKWMNEEGGIPRHWLFSYVWTSTLQSMSPCLPKLVLNFQ